MQKNYNLVKVSALLLLLLIQNNLQAQNRCLDCPKEVKVISDKQVLLDKVEIKDGASIILNTNLYVSYRSGNVQKFWANLAIATAGIAVSTQLQGNSSAEGNHATGISPLIPLGVSVATLPSIWKNRPRGVPQAGLWLQHRDTRGRLTDTWEQPISSEAKNSGELLSINIDKPLTAGTVEVYLQNGSKNPVYYWGYETVKTLNKSITILPKIPTVAYGLGCPSGYLPNGQGRCCNPFNGDCIDEPTGGDGNPTPPPPLPPVPQGCPAGFLPNGQGMCCSPFTGICVNEGGGGGGNPTAPRTLTVTFLGCPDGLLPNGQGMCCRPGTNQCVPEATVQNGVLWKKVITKTDQGLAPRSQSTTQTYETCHLSQTCIEFSWDVCVRDGGYKWSCSGPNIGASICWDELECNAEPSPIQDIPVPYPGTGGSGGNTGGGGGNSPTSDIDRMNRRTGIDDLCNGYKRLWNNSFRNNDPILTKEMGGLLTSNGKIILLPAYNNDPTTTSFQGEYFDDRGREILYFYTQQGQSKADVTIYDELGHSVKTTYEIIATVHTHPYTGPTALGNPVIYANYTPSPNDIDLASTYSDLKHYILTGNTTAFTLIEYDASGKKGYSNPMCL